MSALAELKARVDAAQGADREIDVEAHAVLGLDARRTNNDREASLQHWYIYGRDHDRRDTPFHFIRDGFHHSPDVPAYTSSLDAALALVEAKLPGWGWDMSTVRWGRGGYTASMHRPACNDEISGCSPTPSLALLSALLSALIAEQEEKP